MKETKESIENHIRKTTMPMMTTDEWDFLKSHLNKEDIFLEYGAGSSTKCISPFVKELTSIEHDSIYFDAVKKELSSLHNTNLILIPPNSKKKKKQLKPAKQEDFVNYINYPKTTNKIWTKVLIDGRARQWVAESILDNITKDTIVFIHDFALNGKLNPPKRDRYLRVLDFYEVLKIVDSLVMLRKK